MTATTVTWAAPGSDEWLAARREGIGGSDVPILLNLNPWRSPVDLWLDKLGRDDGFTGNYATARGTHMEPFVIAQFTAANPGTIVSRPGEIPTILAHPDIPAARASLDGIGHDRHGDFVVEAKAVGWRGRGLWESGVPDMYVAQASYQLAVTGLDRAVVVADVAGDYVERWIERDELFVKYVIDLVDDWWARHVVAGVMPDPDPVRDARILPRLWTPDPDASVEVDPALVERLRDTKAAAAAARTDYEVAVASVQAEMRQATVATVGGDVVARWSAVKPRTTVDVAALKADGVYDQYALTGEPGRRFTVSSL